MTERRPYPEISSEEELDELPYLAYLEIAGHLRQIALEEDDDPVAVARQLLERAPANNRFRIVTIQRFSLRPGPPVPEPFVGPQCRAMDALESGVVRCELEAHSDGLDHAGRVLRDGRAAEVHYWRATSGAEVRHERAT
ncbi:hypothetical protein D9753_30415 [Streptomyces dangxiongensis]|uniref:Uncharacterized protein n=1 Tax=Streptomyces dangxiongensis TaxID=1442032 RepID=A0A3G2JJG7_9ACTN|nr:hypothetical protein [Streptomyces dangxiongensis]AYN42484.1 hypothetical protein D9753_30415 [Streptomyces dangxiongensis]